MYLEFVQNVHVGVRVIFNQRLLNKNKGIMMKVKL